MECGAAIVRTLLSSLQGALGDALLFLRNSAAEGAANLLNLGKNADALDEEMRGLRAIRDDLENKVKSREGQPGMTRTHVASEWLAGVDNLHDEVCRLQDSLARLPTFLESCSLGSLRSEYALGGEVVRLLRRVRELRGRRVDVEGQLVDEAPPAPIVAAPSKAAWVVGAELALSEIQRYLRDKKVGMVGIYGMGGVGKTTLLAEINHQFLTEPNHNFDVVIFVTVSGEMNVFKLQEDIGVRLGFPRSGNSSRSGSPLPEKNEDDRRDTLYRALNQKRFLLLLDDLWQALDLWKIGIPHPDISINDGKKIVFTTRSEQICADMDVQRAKVKVSPLGEDQSWELFRSKVDPKVDLDNNADIHALAKVVVRKCGGLPLALITVGRAMSNATHVGEWRQAEMNLRTSPDKIRGMEDVLSILRFSFDKLDNDITRECLLYCALFPEDHNIWIERLVDYWIGEGFLESDSSDSGNLKLSEARDVGDCIIRKLKDACLLESGEDEDTVVKMHDVVREMALWLTGGKFSRMKRFVVCGGGEKGLEQLREGNTWKVASRISVTHSCTLELPSLESQLCRNLSTMLISSEFSSQFVGRYNVLVKQTLAITPNFWESMLALRVLDLSGTDIEEVPDAIGLLVELRYLNLSQTQIIQVPKQLGKLVKLRDLNLSYTTCLRKIPREAILALTNLQKLELFGSYDKWGVDPDGLSLTDMESHLGQFEELSLKLSDLSALEELANLENLRKCTLTCLLIANVRHLTSPHLYAILHKLERLQYLNIRDCDELEEWSPDCDSDEVESTLIGGRRLQVGPALHPPLFQSLLLLYVQFCHQLKDLRWVGQLVHLHHLSIVSCHRLEQLLVDDGEGEEEEADDHKDDHGSSFPKLKSMLLWNLPALWRISRRPLLCPSLERIDVPGCPNLRKLPLGRRSCPKIKTIEGSQEWWDALEWDDYDDDSSTSSIKSALAPFFKPLEF